MKNKSRLLVLTGRKSSVFKIFGACMCVNTCDRT